MYIVFQVAKQDRLDKLHNFRRPQTSNSLDKSGKFQNFLNKILCRNDMGRHFLKLVRHYIQGTGRRLYEWLGTANNHLIRYKKNPDISMRLLTLNIGRLDTFCMPHQALRIHQHCNFYKYRLIKMTGPRYSSYRCRLPGKTNQLRMVCTTGHLKKKCLHCKGYKLGRKVMYDLCK